MWMERRKRRKTPMISYDLAKKLKDAGFPQINQYWSEGEYVWRDCPGCFFAQDGNKDPEGSVYCPTLSELIAACGDEFMSLNRTYDGAWWVQGVELKGYERASTALVRKKADTPEEAVANLWLALNAPENK
jgi:hypothetical protein